MYKIIAARIYKWGLTSKCYGEALHHILAARYAPDYFSKNFPATELTPGQYLQREYIRNRLHHTEYNFNHSLLKEGENNIFTCTYSKGTIDRLPKEFRTPPRTDYILTFSLVNHKITHAVGILSTEDRQHYCLLDTTDSKFTLVSHYIHAIFNGYIPHQQDLEILENIDNNSGILPALNTLKKHIKSFLENKNFNVLKTKCEILKTIWERHLSQRQTTDSLNDYLSYLIKNYYSALNLDASTDETIILTYRTYTVPKPVQPCLPGFDMTANDVSTKVTRTKSNSRSPLAPKRQSDAEQLNLPFTINTTTETSTLKENSPTSVSQLEHFPGLSGQPASKRQKTLSTV